MTFRNAMALVGAFIESEGLGGGPASDPVQRSFGKINRYLLFLSILAARHRETAQSYGEAVRAYKEAQSQRRAGLSINLTPAHERTGELFHHLQLDIESFYLFAKIMLGRVAQAVEQFFGQGRKVPLGSHHKLVQNLAALARQKELVLEPGLLLAASALQREVVDYRDNRIEHAQDPWEIKGMSYDSDGTVRVVSSLRDLDRAEKESPTESTPVGELEDRLCAYVEQVMQFVTANRDKSKLKHQRGRPDPSCG